MSKQVFNVIINTGDISTGANGYVTYHKVNSVSKFVLFASNRYPNWKFATIYDHATKGKIEVIKP